MLRRHKLGGAAPSGLRNRARSGPWFRRSQPWRGRLSVGLRARVDVAEAALPDKVVSTEHGAYFRDEEMARVEAALFLAREPLSSRKIAQLAGLADGTAARTLVRRLNKLLDRSGSSFRVEEIAGGFQLMTRPMFGSWLRKILQTPIETRLSVPALETLAVIAYRQPVLRTDIEAIRGVQCGDILRQLMERDLVRIAGRSDELGRPLKYGTTKRFLQSFGLRHLDELPRAETLRRAEFPPEKGIELLAGTGQSTSFIQLGQSEDEEDSK